MLIDTTKIYSTLASQIETALFSHPSVEDCVVRIRETKTQQQELVAYVVLTGQFSPDRLQSYLLTVLPNQDLPPVNVVSLSKLPLTTEGKIDEQKLASVAVIEPDVLQNWEKQLQSIPEIEQVAVVVQEQTEEIPPVHLSDLLPNWDTPTTQPIPETETPHTSANTSAEATAPKPLAQIDGGILQLQPDTPTVLSEALQRAVKTSPNKGITYIRSDGFEVMQSYPELLIEAERILAGLRKLGLKPQDKVIFQFNENQDYIPAFWGCVLGGFVPVPISVAPSYEPENSVVKKLHHAWQLLEQPVILTSKSLSTSVGTLSDKLNLNNFRVETIESLRTQEQDSNWHNVQPDDLAVILLTSGSTGMPKGVTLSHRNLISSIAGTSAKDGFTQDEVSLNWLPLDHPGPLIRCVIRVVYLGCQQIHAPTGLVLQNPLKWLDWIENYRVTITWAPNFAYALLSERSEQLRKGNWDLSSVRCFLNTAEPIVPKTAEKVLDLLKPYGLKPTVMNSSWGMAETSSGVTSSYQYLEAAKTPPNDTFAQLGSPIPGICLRIVDENNQVVPEETTGFLQVKGATVTSGYYQNPQVNSESFTEDGWFKTGDLAFLKQGNLTLTGRSKDIIIINGNNCYSHEIESAVEEVEGVEVSYTAACATRKPGSNTDDLVIFFHTEITADNSLHNLLKNIQKNVVKKIGVKPSYLIPVAKETIPKTSIGKIQRSQLKQKFEEGEFTEIVKRTDVLLGNENTLPDWFYRKSWQPKAAIAFEKQEKNGQTVVFLDSLGLGKYLLEKTKNSITVEAGLEFVKLSEKHYKIDKTNPDHYRDLFESILKDNDNQPIVQIFHLWSYYSYTGEIESLEALEQALDNNVYSLLWLVQGLAKVTTPESPIRLGVISSHVQFTGPDDEVAYEKAPILGMIKTLPRELPWLDCVHIDLPVAEVELNATHLLEEISVQPREREVAYRNGQRLIAKLEPAQLPQQPQQDLPFKTGGMILMSGGLGGIGTEIARYLLENYQARLLLLGRSPLPESNTWDAELENDGKMAKRIQAYLSLEELDGEIRYEAADISNVKQLQEIIDRAEQDWSCQLDGIIHLAGVAPERLLVEETRDSFLATLAPKVLGTWALHQLIKNKPDSFFISFSSIISFFGGATVGAYATANNFLDSFASYHKHKQHRRNFCLSSSTWDDIGVSQGYEGKELTRAQGHYAMSPNQGLSSLLAGVYRDQGHILIGLEGGHSNIRSFTSTPAIPTRKLCAYFTAKSPLQLKELEVSDRFGTLTHCEFRQLKEMPLIEEGEIDREKLAAGDRTKEFIAPRNDIESRLVNIWQKVLGVSQVSIRDNFFELGGQSLLAISLFAEIESEFGKKLPLATLFEASTIEQLAQIFDPNANQTLASDSLVLINAGGSKTPIFMLHDADGETILYLNLARYFLERSVYGLRPYGKPGFPIVHTRFEEMVNHYIEKIRSIQPHGPYLLGGLCAGGVLAFATATELQARGEEVSLVALIDSLDVAAPPRIGKMTKERLNRLSKAIAQGKDKKGVSQLIYTFTQIMKKVQGATVYELKNRVNQLQLQLKLTLFRYYLDKGLPLPKFLKNITPRQVYRFGKKSYVPGVFKGRLLVFRATEGEGAEEPAINMTIDPFLGWGQRATEEVEVYDIIGNHSSMLQEPYVKEMADRMKAYLDSIGALN